MWCSLFLRAASGSAAAQAELPLAAAAGTAALSAPAAAAADELRAALAALNPDELSPKAALEALYRLRQRFEQSR